MSMPIISTAKNKRCDAITDIIESVALEQTALSHILNAEGEKIDSTVKFSESHEEIIEVNNSVLQMVNAITRLETMLHGKLELFKDCLCTECSARKCKLELIVKGANSGKIEDTGINDTYIFTPGEDKSIIQFITIPTCAVSVIGNLPAGVTFANNILTIPNTLDFTKEYIMTFNVNNEYAVKIKILKY